MTHKIFFGDVEVLNTKTKQIQIFPRQVFTEITKLDEPLLRAFVLDKMKHAERENYQVVRLCFDTAKHVGFTAY